ncbi:MAG: hypothetical protein IPO83_00340 [Chitinophagaceae bacterium]|nr:hypothetical protein [Chitinophagaceae bacterium]
MKINIIQRGLLILLSFFILCFTNRSAAQTTTGWKEMVAGLSPADHTGIDYLVPVIRSMPGISYSGYCEKHSCLLLLFDPAIYPEEEMLIHAFAERKLSIYPKGNTTFRMISEECYIDVSKTNDHK